MKSSNTKEFIIVDQRANKSCPTTQGTFNPLETRSMNEMYTLIYNIAHVPPSERDFSIINFRSYTGTIYISSPCDLMGRDDITAVILDKETSSKSDGEQTFIHSELEGPYYTHINPMPLFKTNEKGKFTKRPLSSDIPTERAYLHPKLQSASPKSQNITDYSTACNGGIHMQLTENFNLKRRRKYLRKPNEADYYKLIKENDVLKNTVKALEEKLKKTRENYGILKKQIVDPSKLQQFAKEKIEEEWEQKKTKIFAQLLSSHTGLMERIAKEKLQIHFTNKQKDIDSFLEELIKSKLSVG